MTKTLIYDLEIIRCIPDRDGFRDPGYEYCNGWEDHPNMEISCMGWAWLEDDRVGVAEWGDPAIAAVFAEFDTLIGFNSISFDDALAACNGFPVSTDYDLLHEVRIAAYGSPDYRDQPPGFSYALGAIGEANGFPKTGTGANAAKRWQDGARGEVMSYCLNDVMITAALLKRGLAGELIDPNTGELLPKLAPLPGGNS